MTESDVEAYKRECLERWRSRKPRRRKLALQLMLGRSDVDDNWPDWVKADIETEINQIKAEREAEGRRSIEAEKTRAVERVDKEFLD